MKTTRRNTLATAAACAVAMVVLVAPAAMADEPCVPHWENSIGQPGFDDWVRALHSNGPHLYAGGWFTVAGQDSVNHIAKWDGNSWHPLGDGVNGNVLAITSLNKDSSNKIYVGGQFTSAGGSDAHYVAMWDGANWSPMGAGMDERVRTLAVFDDGTGPAIYAGGAFTMADGTLVNRIAKWDGTQWLALDPELPDGGGMNAGVNTLMVFDDGNGEALYAGGWFTMAGGIEASRIARWNGTQWSPVADDISGNGQTFINALEVIEHEETWALYAGGQFTTAGAVSANNVARWDGVKWSSLGTGTNGPVREFAIYDDGSGPALYVGGWYTVAGGVTVNRVGKWDGKTWTSLGTGVNGVVETLTRYHDNNGTSLVVGGNFSSAGGVTANGIALWTGAGQPPSVHSHPSNAIGLPGQHIIMTTSASGSDSLLFQWRKNGEPLKDSGHISGTTTDTLTFEGVMVSDTGEYDVVVSNPCGSVTSDPASLTVMFFPEPLEQTVYEGNATVFSVDLVEGGGVDYQWRKDGDPLSDGPNIVGAQWPTIVLLSPKVDDSGEYDVVVSGEFGEAISESATLAVCLLGDLNGDGVVNVLDLLLLLEAWGTCADPDNCPADLNGDDVVNVLDLLILLENWG